MRKWTWGSTATDRYTCTSPTRTCRASTTSACRERVLSGACYGKRQRPRTSRADRAGSFRRKTPGCGPACRPQRFTRILTASVAVTAQPPQQLRAVKAALKRGRESGARSSRSPAVKEQDCEQQFSTLHRLKLRTRGFRRHRRDTPVLELEHLIIAKGFDEFSIRNERQRNCIRPRFYKSLGVVDCNNKVHVTHTGPLKSLDNVKCVAVWIGHVGAEPAAIPESCAFDHEHVGFPSADRITQPSRVHFACFRQRAAVGKDLTEHHSYERFMQKCREHRRLKDLEGAACVDTRHTER